MEVATLRDRHAFAASNRARARHPVWPCQLAWSLLLEDRAMEI